MKKALKFGDAEIHGDEAVKIPNSGDVRKFVERALKLGEELDNIKADLKALYDDAHDQGIDRKELKAVVKHKKHPVSIEFRQGVNELLEKLGEQLLFAFIQDAGV